MRQLVQTAGARHVVRHRARNEMIPPEDRRLVAIRHCLLQQIDQRQHDGVEVPGHLLGTPTGGTVGLRGDLAERQPLFLVFDL